MTEVAHLAPNRRHVRSQELDDERRAIALADATMEDEARLRRRRSEVSLDPRMLDAEMPRYLVERKRGNHTIAYALLAVTFVVFGLLLWPWLSERFV